MAIERVPAEPGFELQPNGDAAVDIRFFAEPSAALSETIISLAESINANTITGVTELVPAYQCLTVCYNPLQLPCASDGTPGASKLRRALAAITEKALAQNTPSQRERYLIRIPVCYHDDFAPDMRALCAHTGLTPKEVISRHTAPSYLVHMLGFTPGFLYLGGLDQGLHCPRKARPALRVPAGSVGIGGSQTGIYPQTTPGGWQVIGRTPLALFRPQQEPAYIAHPLDQVQFFAISKNEFSGIDPFSSPEQISLIQASSGAKNP